MLLLKIFGTLQTFILNQFWSRRPNTVCLGYRHFYDMPFTIEIMVV